VTDAVITEIGSAVPSRRLAQTELCELVCSAIPPEKSEIRSLVKRIYAKSGISKRHTVLDGFPQVPGSVPLIPDTPRSHNGPSTAVRNRMYREKVTPLATIAAQKALTGCDPGSITHLITASCTGFYAPGIDIDLIGALHLSPQTARLHIGFMGCYAAFPALRTAAAICTAFPDAAVLVVCAELCSLHYHHSFVPESILANSLFADGAGAAVVRSSKGTYGRGLLLKSFTSSLLPDTGDTMSWIIGNHGFSMTLSPEVPQRIGSGIGSLMEAACAGTGTDPAEVCHYAIHPGGRAILDAAEKALAIPEEAIASPRRVLNEYGNMSSATTLFVLNELLHGNAAGPVFSAAFGPGLTAE
jgi:predicted naringenin-chalcone synthase